MMGVEWGGVMIGVAGLVVGMMVMVVMVMMMMMMIEWVVRMMVD